MNSVFIDPAPISAKVLEDAELDGIRVGAAIDPLKCGWMAIAVIIIAIA